MTDDLPPGLFILQGNRLEWLRDLVLEVLARQPLAPLKQEVVLVQSNGAAEWLKMALAAHGGICAATRVELPGRFLWRIYRQVLGRAATPSQSPLDKPLLVWRLMRLLGDLPDETVCQPLRQYLQGQGAQRRLQLAQRLADLYDQYQIYRGDWLDAWARDRDVLIDARGQTTPLPEDQRWQPWLWRRVLGELSEAERAGTRAEVQRAFVQALQSPLAAGKLPRRVVLFGASHLPAVVLDALVALSRHAQVLIALPNPCRYHWADIIDGRELLRDAPRRRPLRAEDLAGVSLEAMHAHAHPLLAAWGRQGRDFMRQLDAFDDRASANDSPGLPRLDQFDEAPGDTLLEQVQAAIRDLLPLPEHPRHVMPAADRSVVFHIAHSAQREVEILHDQLLHLLAQPGDRPLRPRDIVVMTPDITPFAPAIRAVFGQYPPGDARFIPFDIADLSARTTEPFLVALDWLLRLPQERILASEVAALFDVPAIARRFGIEPQDRPRLTQWIAGAGVRWGLNTEQRAGLGLGACGEQNTWRFGLRRMLLGYTGAGDDGFAGIVPFDEIGGLDAALVGPLADLLDVLQDWWRTAREGATPLQWAQRARDLLDAISQPQDLRERETRASLDDALSSWVEHCASAGFNEAVPLEVLGEAWLSGLDEAASGGRFLAGGVTFCTLMPLRSIPFEVVCLLGMNEGDYPRQSPRSDFDLLHQPGQYRPGDRARREDDRYLMLEALLSARRMLYVSWAGRSARDNTEQPPSVLVAQLRDYLAAGWQGEADAHGKPGDLLAQRTTVHPLQPFSRRYFEGDAQLFTYAREWRQAHTGPTATAQESPKFEPWTEPLTVQQLARFLKNPVKTFFRARLDVVFDELQTHDDDEVFSLDPLDRYALRDRLIEDPHALTCDDAQAVLARRAQRELGSGVLPMRHLGERVAVSLVRDVQPALACWQTLAQAYPEAVDKLRLNLGLFGLQIDDWLEGLRSGGRKKVWLELSASKLCDGDGKVRADRLLEAWVRQIVASSCGHSVGGVLVGLDARIEVPPLGKDEATGHLLALLQAWHDGMREPLPFTARTALADLKDGKGQQAYDGGFNNAPEVQEPCLARMFPGYAALAADGRLAAYTATLFKPLFDWAQQATVFVHDTNVGDGDTP
ncbi:exodeoxyribonuclease V subunit gamma [Thiomonas bhubaneswarensis]|uniref:RecBCD enzyme subunit RecC n=1 Tax=Thiomonas bhubaneswarensis TaxID=339866 RepID=A0A0K6IAM4_9BURK|nr:exodeoxyribonuclease V subunit gamma [Thiomonas bhubaneswarensis]CUB00185.1 DNA helicase/exodeoxyribonuclease V, gamma subunit [Thiomonas bhubaneswarensis]